MTTDEFMRKIIEIVFRQDYVDPKDLRDQFIDIAYVVRSQTLIEMSDVLIDHRRGSDGEGYLLLVNNDIRLMEPDSMIDRIIHNPDTGELTIYVDGTLKKD